ncbi:MAG: hypothetical protein ABI741_05120 [Ferruginibacter sp.]
MEDRLGKYIRLFGSIFFSVIGFIIAFILVLLGIKFLFGLMSYIPWFTYVYISFIILVPSALFITAFIIYFKRTATHANKVVRWLSYFLFSVALVAWMVTLFLDIRIFYKHAYDSIGMYNSYDMIFLAANVASLFLVGVMQAFTTVKEKDWMEKSNSKFEV